MPRMPMSRPFLTKNPFVFVLLVSLLLTQCMSARDRSAADTNVKATAEPAHKNDGEDRVNITSTELPERANTTRNANTTVTNSPRSPNATNSTSSAGRTQPPTSDRVPSSLPPSSNPQNNNARNVTIPSEVGNTARLVTTPTIPTNVTRPSSVTSINATAGTTSGNGTENRSGSEGAAQTTNTTSTTAQPSNGTTAQPGNLSPRVLPAAVSGWLLVLLARAVA